MLPTNTIKMIQSGQLQEHGNPTNFVFRSPCRPQQCTTTSKYL